MLKKVLLLLIITLTTSGMYAQKNVTLKEATSSGLRAKRLRSITNMPDGESYVCLEKGTVVRYSYKTGKKIDVLFDCGNTVGEKVKDIDGFELSPDGQRMLVFNNTKAIYRHSFTADYYIYNISSKKLSKLSDGGPQQSPVWSQDGNQVAFVRDNNIFLVKLLYDNSESQVTKDGVRNKIINGIPDWVNEEEFSCSTALCFTADGTQICWLKYDETDVPQYQLQMFKGMKPEIMDNADYPHDYEYKYPKAGHKNSIMTAWSYDIQAHRIQQLQLPLQPEDYVCRLFPTDDPQSVLFVTLNRHQDNMSIYKVNPRSTVSKLIITEKDSKYVSETAYSEMQIQNGSILMLSDRDGYRHIYQYSATSGSLIRSVTPAKTDITTLYGIDKNGDIYYQAAPTPLTRKVYVSHRNGKIECLTPKEGWNNATFSATMQNFVCQWSDRNHPYTYTSMTSQGKVVTSLLDNAELEAKLKQYNIPERELFSFTTSEGVSLNGCMMKPVDFDANKKYPVIMHQYSGPGSQRVKDSWALGSMSEGALFEAYLASLGFVVVSVDGRGTGARGSEFERCTYLRLGELESRDQVEAAIWIGQQSYVDASRIGIWGWSFGGFNTLMSMSEGRPVFASGVAIAPPTNWKFYDSIYTERYMRTPNENPDGYAVNPIERVKNLHGALLICHGLADDNVHPQNTFEYSEALVQADKDFRELIYTNRNHSIFGGNTRNHLLRQVTTHFLTTLKP